MGGAYTAKPAETTEVELPPGWPSHWPFPGVNPPGHDPTYAISFATPTPDEVSVGEEITVSVKVYEEGAGNPPSKLGTIAPDEPISWEAYVDGFLIAYASVGWISLSGFYYSDWTFTPELFPSDVTEPPKVMTVYADGVMNNGGFSSPLSAEREIDIAAPSLDVNVSSWGGMTSGGFMNAAIWLFIFDDEGTLLTSASFGGTHYEGSGELIKSYLLDFGTLPEGLTWDATMPSGDRIDVVVSIPVIKANERYIIDGKASGYHGNPTGLMSAELSSGSSQSSEVTSSINWLEGQLEIVIESDALTWLSTWKDGVGGWPSPW